MSYFSSQYPGLQIYPQQPTSYSLDGAYPEMGAVPSPQLAPQITDPLQNNLGSNNPASALYTPAGSAAAAEPAAQSAGVAGNSGALTGAAIGAGLGLLSSIGQQNSYKAKMHALAETQRYSPWTHMQGQTPQDPNALGQVAGLAASGATLGQGLAGGSLLPAAYMSRPQYGWNGIPNGQY